MIDKNDTWRDKERNQRDPPSNRVVCFSDVLNKKTVQFSRCTVFFCYPTNSATDQSDTGGKWFSLICWILEASCNSRFSLLNSLSE